jgi:hypothetical protein
MVTVEIDVDISDFDDDVLLEEVHDRGISEIPPLSSGDKHPMHAAYHALKAGDERRALEVTRSWLCDELGVVL